MLHCRGWATVVHTWRNEVPDTWDTLYLTQPSMFVSMIRLLPLSLLRSETKVNITMSPYLMLLRSWSGWSMPWRTPSNHIDLQHNNFASLFSERRQRRSTCYAIFSRCKNLQHPHFGAWLLIVSLLSAMQKVVRRSSPTTWPYYTMMAHLSQASTR